MNTCWLRKRNWKKKKNYYISSIKYYAREKHRCFFRAMALRCDPELAASAESGNLLKMHILKLHPRPTTESETPGERPNYLILQAFQMIPMQWRLRATREEASGHDFQSVWYQSCLLKDGEKLAGQRPGFQGRAAALPTPGLWRGAATARGCKPPSTTSLTILVQRLRVMRTDVTGFMQWIRSWNCL